MMAFQAIVNKLVSPAGLSMFWAGTSIAIDVEAVVKFKAPVRIETFKQLKMYIFL